ncbi:MAG: hypothetical protein ACM3US_00215 [Sphingomonadaceae bacterium]
MAERETRETRFDEDEEERILTLKISLEGPAELIQLIRESTPGMMGKRLSGLLPREFREHMMAAQREQMLAFRSLLDAAISRMEPRKREEKPRRQSTRVEVE